MTASAGNKPDERSVVELIQDHVFAPDQHLGRGLGEISRGSMATIEVAIDRTLGRRVALKTMRGDYQASALAVRSFIREAQITGQLDHPNIVPIHALSRDGDGRLYFTMKLIEGRSLSAILEEARAGQVRLDERRRLIPTALDHEALAQVVEIFIRVLDAVAFAHARGVVHCDIKPENIMVGDYGQVYLMDWSVAKDLPEPPGSTAAQAWVRGILPMPGGKTRVVMGTPNYMSPEQARGAREHLDPRSDVFSLGAVLFEIVTGQPPYLGDTPQQILDQAVACKVVVPAELPISQELRRILAVAMHPEPRFRYADVRQFRADLIGFVRGRDNFPRQRFAQGEWLIREGEVGDAAYILVSGRCEVSKMIEGKQESLRTLDPGEVFGETSILAASPRTASVVALTDVVAVRLTAEDLEREIGAMKPWMVSFIRALARRFSALETKKSRAAVDPLQVANLALMTLETWGRADEGGATMGLGRLCESIGEILGAGREGVLAALQRDGHFEIDPARDVVLLPRARRQQLVEALTRARA